MSNRRAVVDVEILPDGKHLGVVRIVTDILPGASSELVHRCEDTHDSHEDAYLAAQSLAAQLLQSRA